MPHSDVMPCHMLSIEPIRYLRVTLTNRSAFISLLCNNLQAHLLWPRFVATPHLFRQQSRRGLCNCVCGLTADQM